MRSQGKRLLEALKKKDAPKEVTIQQKSRSRPKTKAIVESKPPSARPNTKTALVANPKPRSTRKHTQQSNNVPFTPAELEVLNKDWVKEQNVQRKPEPQSRRSPRSQRASASRSTVKHASEVKQWLFRDEDEGPADTPEVTQTAVKEVIIAPKSRMEMEPTNLHSQEAQLPEKAISTVTSFIVDVVEDPKT